MATKKNSILKSDINNSTNSWCTDNKTEKKEGKLGKKYERMLVKFEEITSFLKDVAPLDMFVCFINDLPRDAKLPLVLSPHLKAQFSLYFYRERRKSFNRNFILPCVVDKLSGECKNFGWPSDWQDKFAMEVLKKKYICVELLFFYEKVKKKRKNLCDIQSSLCKQNEADTFALEPVQNVKLYSLSNSSKTTKNFFCLSTASLSFSIASTHAKFVDSALPLSSSAAPSSNSTSSMSLSPHCSIPSSALTFTSSPLSSSHLSSSCLSKDSYFHSLCHEKSCSALHIKSHSLSSSTYISLDKSSSSISSASPPLTETNEKSEIRYGSYSTQGIRSYNEDRVLHIQDLVADLILTKKEEVNNDSSFTDNKNDTVNSTHFNLFNNNNKAMFFGVYDGHNGEEAVDFVLKNLHKNIFKNLNIKSDRHIYTQNISDCFVKAFKITDENLREFFFEEKKQKNDPEEIDYLQFTSGCTACVCFFTGRYLIIANLGDSRVAISRGGVGITLNEEHRINVNKKEQSRVLHSGGFFDSDGYIAGSLGVSRAFGDFDKISQQKILGLSNSPEMFFEELRNEDEFMIIACDGVFDVMTTQDAVTFVRNFLMSCNDPNAAAKYLCEIALARKSLDNVSAIIVLFQSPEKKGENSCDSNSREGAQNSQNIQDASPVRRLKINFSALKNLL